MSAQSSYLNKKGLTVKDLVTIGIFTALFFVFELIGSLPFAPNPALTFYQPFGIALLCGPVYLLMVAKVPKRGGIAILGIINGIIWYILGMHWGMDLGYIVMGIVAEIVAGIKGYRNVKWEYGLLCSFLPWAFWCIPGLFCRSCCVGRDNAEQRNFTRIH